MAANMLGVVFKRVKAFWRFFYCGRVGFWGIFGRREGRAGGVWKASSAKREEFGNGLTVSW
jgi:hypothetical protein